MLMNYWRSRREGAKKEAEKREAEEEKKRSFSSSVNELDGGDYVQTWTVVLDDAMTTIVLYRNNFQVHCNGEVVLTNIENSSVDTLGPVISFMIGNHKAQISSTQSQQQPNMSYTLTIDDQFTPSTSSSCDMEERRYYTKENADSSKR